MRGKIHLHEEQFDEGLHAACLGLDADRGSRRIVDADAFKALPRATRCRRCAAIYWPHGGEPTDPAETVDLVSRK